MANNEIQLLEKIELQFCLAENEVQFEKKLEIFLSPVLKKLASPHEFVRKKVIEILNHIKKRMKNTVKLPWNSLIEIVYSDNFMNSTLVKNFTIVYLKTAYDRLTEKDKITYLSPLIKNIELKLPNQKEFLFEIILELLQKSSLKLSDLETKEVDTSSLELIGRILLFGLLKIIKETNIEKFNNLMTEQEIKLLFRPFYGPLDLCIHNPEEDNEILKVIIIKFQEINQLDQFNQWTNEENVHAIINILEENIDEMGSSDGMCILGSCYKDGIGVVKDEHKAFFYYQKSAEMGNSNGINNTGYCYGKGIGIEKDEYKAFTYCQKSAEMEMGSVEGIYSVGQCYRDGIGVVKDERKAFIYYQKSMEMGDADGTYRVRYCYLNGIGIEKDEHKAFIYCQKSAEMGNTSALRVIAYCYLFGIGVEKNEHKAFIYFQKSAEFNDAPAMSYLGYCYLNGIGGERNYHKAFTYFQKSVEMGHDASIPLIGACYQKGIGIEKDEYKSFIYYQKSAEIGDTYGMAMLGYCYRNGVGTTINLQKANFWYKK
ncbi:hypothetical protein C2G38_2144461 [Gigaspora rosea]|uniref:Proteasome component Ecm29 N-terminal domain-containing protein n=1 Tax=Gigaspora rosea TaxID=44941 RepID=A0A397UW79_9GLOM|nr:hypothetical protein C2G38_2144461 [Gigaspora rosea]